MGNKKAFDLSRDSVYVADPITDLRIIGGTILEPDEAGDLDTDPDETNPLNRSNRLRTPLSEAFKANIAHRGVDTPIKIVKLDDVAVVVAGTSRVRAARAANRERKKRGELLIKIKCVIQRDVSKLALISSVASENSARHDDSFSSKLDQLKIMIDAGASEEDAARVFAVSPATIRGWLVFEDQATEATKQAVRDGRVPASTAAELARIKEPEAQDAALATMLSAPERKARTTRAAKMLRGAKGSKGLTSRKEQEKFLDHVQKMSHGARSEKALAFWEGVEEALKLVLGKEIDERLKNAMTKARA